MKTALLVVDVQESFRHRPYWDATEVPAFLARLQTVIDACAARGVPVVQVFHQEDDAAATDPFSPQSGYVAPLEGLRIAPTQVFRKSVHSALYARDAAGTTLEAWLRAEGIDELVVTGIRTEQCCETTTRHAFDAGFSVRYVTEATLTFAMTHASGRVFSPAEIRERTELVLAGRFATIVSAEAALAAA